MNEILRCAKDESDKGDIEMPETDWVVVNEVYGEIQGELLRGLLEAQGIPVILNEEGAGRAYGIMAGPLGQVQILVPARFLQQARQVL